MLFDESKSLNLTLRVFLLDYFLCQYCISVVISAFSNPFHIKMLYS